MITEQREEAWRFPIAATPREADERRTAIAAALRRLADDVESGDVRFQEGERVAIVREFTGTAC